MSVPTKDGYYWLFQKDLKPRVILFFSSDASIAFCGSDEDKYLEDIIKFEKLVGPITPPVEVKEKQKAPWPDYKGNDIYEHSMLMHPSGQIGIVKYYPERMLSEDQWIVSYDTESPLESRLCLQIGDKGQAVIYNYKYENPSCFGKKLNAEACYTNCPVKDECYGQN